jgi:site-specific recombinase XerD
MGVIDFQQAARRLRQKQASMALPATLGELLSAWLRDRRADNKRPRGVENYEDVFRRFIRFSGDIPVEELTTELIQTYKVDLMQRVSAGTARHALTVVRMFCAWAVENHYLTYNPALAVQHPRVEVADPDPLTRAQIDELLAVLDKPSQTHKARWRRNRRAMYLMLYAGLRLSEVAGLKWRDVDLDRRTLTVRREIAKGGKSRVLPICVELYTELNAANVRKAEWAVVDQGETDEGQGKHLTPKSLAHIFERFLPRRGIHIHAHQLRKTFATELYVRGEDIATIQRLLGHSDPKTTMRYIGASSEKEQQAVERLRFRHESEPHEPYRKR